MREFFDAGVAPARGQILAWSRVAARWAKVVWLICLLASLLPSAYAQTTTRGFGNGTNQFTMDFVTIGNPNNVADTTGTPNPVGSVAYTYNLGKYEVSREQIDKANTAGGLGITMSDMSRYGGNGVNKPATGVTWHEAAKFVNWLNTSTGGTAAYKFVSGTLQPWAPTDAGYNANNLFRNSQAKYVIASRDEWYKGAYGSPNGTWYNYPTGSDSRPSAVAGGTGPNTAVYGGQAGPADINNAGGLSAYGTMGQGGNVWEWNETAYDGVYNTAGESLEMRSGSWDIGIDYLDASYRNSYIDPAIDGNNSYGFRVASVDLTALDSDGDGLSDAVETNTGVFVSASGTGTNPNNPDTDGDGISDDVEVNTLNSNPNVSQIPEALLAQQSGPDGFVATWGVVTGATGYEVQVSTERSFTSGLIGGDRPVSLGTTTSLGITGISGQIRYYRVRSVLPSQDGPLKTAWSPAVSAPDRSAFGKYATLNASGNADNFQAAVGSSANNSSYTISFWMRPDRLGGVSGSENVQVFRQPINNNASAANVDIDLLPDGSLVFGQRSELGEEHFVSTPADTVLPGNWVHVTAVRDAANAALRLYINGAEIAAKSSAFGTNPWNIENSGGLGATQAALNNDSNVNRIRAAFDDVRIYRTVRTPAQILQDVGAPLAVAAANADSTLVFYAPMEGSSLGSTDVNTFFKGTLNGSGTGTITSQSVLTAPVLAWTPSPINLVAPAVLSANELTATASVSGSWSYLPAAGTSLSVGTNAVVGTFVPADLATYSIATITNRVVVSEPDARRLLVWGAGSFTTNAVMASGVAQAVIASASVDTNVIAVLKNGGVTTWSLTGDPVSALDAPGSTQADVAMIAAGEEHFLALKNDGQVVAWGRGFTDEGSEPNFGQSVVPPDASTGVVAVAAGDYHSLALRGDGRVVAWGWDNYGQSQVPAAASNGVVAIAAGRYTSFALKFDGTLVSWGRGEYGATLPADATNGVVAISAGRQHAMALKSDGTVKAWGTDAVGQRKTATGSPAGLSGVTAVTAGRYYSMALKSDRTVEAWGETGYANDPFSPPADLTNVVSIHGGRNHGLAIVSEGEAPRMSLAAGGIQIGSGANTNLAVLVAGTGTTFGSVGLPAGVTLSPAGILSASSSVQPTNVMVRLMAANPNGEDARVVKLEIASTNNAAALAFTYEQVGGEITITGYTGTGGVVEIPAMIGGVAVTQIGNEAFKNVTSITNLTLPSSVTTIGEKAFEGCTQLTSISMPNGVATIGQFAFAGCSSLTSITLPTSLTSLSDYLFQGCGALTAIVIPNGVITIGANAFESCANLVSVTLPSTVTEIKSGAFFNCPKLASITIPGAVTTIGDNAFSNSSTLASVTFLGNTPPTFGSPTPFGGIAAGAKGYYPATASAEWGLVNQIGGLTIVHPDTQSPVITLFGGNPLEIYKGATFSDPGATVTDNVDATRTITGSGTVNTATIGIYTLTYTATDASGNLAVPVTRTVNVVLDPAGDEDGDGVTNGAESSAGTNPLVKNILRFQTIDMLALGKGNFSIPDSNLAGGGATPAGFRYSSSANAAYYGGVPFFISDQANQVWHAARAPGGNGTGVVSETFPIAVNNVYGFYTLAGLWWGVAGSYVTYTFNFSDGSSYSKGLINNEDLRDYNIPSSFANSINGTTTQNVFVSGGYHLDRQWIDFAAAGHGGKNLVSFTVTDNGADAAQDPSRGSRIFLAAATAQVGAPGQIPVDATDTDGDGILDSYELGLPLSTKPDDADTDDDGLSDGIEVGGVTDPLNPDSDNDGLKDGEEVITYGTNPLLADTDGDGAPDGVEVTAGTNPKQNSSLPKPVITSQPVSITRTSGEGVTFSVTAVNPVGVTSELTYQWYKNGTGIPTGTNPNLIMLPLTIAEAGNYSVVVSNAYGAVTSNIASLTVNKASPIITVIPTAASINYGQTLGSSALTGGSASVSGRFDWANSAALPSAGTVIQEVTFTPKDTANYNTVTTSVNVTVNKATPTITALPGFMSATGGTISGSGDFIIHTFTNVGNSTFKPTGSGTVEILVVAGGGGAGYDGGGGGGAGGVITNTVSVTAGTEYTVVVGGGGAAAPGPQWGANGSSGGNSQFGSFTAIGGAGGYNGHAEITAITTGGSGGGEGFAGGGPGNGTPGQGNRGGYKSMDSAGGGGGGAGEVGGNASSGRGGNGGKGIQSDISGVATWYGGGGAGGSWEGIGGTGGMGGGGNGGGRNATAGANGIANTGGGGGGNGYASSSDSGMGGSGIVIVRYKPKILTYGQSIGEVTFPGAAASVPGTFAFANPSATPAAGNNSLSVIFTPTDAVNYNTTTTSVNVKVNKATPSITSVPTATPISYGQTLAFSALSGGVASVPGSFAWADSAAAPETGTTIQNVIFTPEDRANYSEVTIPVNVTVNQALISSGFSHTLYLAIGASNVTAWGMNTDGRLGVGDMNSPVNWAKIVQGIPVGATVDGLAAGGTHSLILAGGQVYAAGSDRYGQLGQGAVNGANKTSFTSVAILSNTPVAVSAGGNHSLIVMADGKVFACGDNTYGQLAQPAATASSGALVEVNFPDLSTKIVSVVAGADHNLAVDEDGGVWVWGRNNYGQLGKGNRSVAERIPSKLDGVTARSVAAGFSHSLILETSGTVLGFGRSNVGQAGQDTSYVMTPTPIEGLIGIESIAAGTDSSFAIDGEGQLRGWGYNAYGELLLGYASPSSSPGVYGPTPSPIATRVSKVSGGGYSSLAVGAQGVIFGGRNDVGQSGNGPDPGLVVGDYYYEAGDLTLNNLMMDLAGTTETLYDQIFVGNGAVTLNGILNLMFVGSYTGPVYGTPQTFDLIWAKGGIVLGTGYQLAFNQAGYLVENAVVDKSVEGVSGKVLQATVRAVVTAGDLAKAVDLASPSLDQVQSISYSSGAPVDNTPLYGVSSYSAVSVSPVVEMIYSYSRPTGGVTSGSEYFFDGITYRVEQGSSPTGPWLNATVSGTTVTPLGNGYERATLRISSLGGAGFLRIQVESLQANGINAGAGSAVTY